MKIGIEWQPPVILARHKKLVYIESQLLSSLLDKAGIYYFSRKFGVKYEPFYIGETLKIRSRLKQHLRGADIREILKGIDEISEEIGQGARYFHYGYLKGEFAIVRKLGIVQKYMITKALEEEFTLLNKQHTRVPTHKIEFSGSKLGKGIFPKEFAVRA